MPEGAEYLHLVQMALDTAGLRYQVIDTDGIVREALEWPGGMAGAPDWTPLPAGQSSAPICSPLEPAIRQLRVRGRAGSRTSGAAETLLETWSPGPSLAPLWIGLTGAARKLTVSLAPEAGRSPHVWFGPELPASASFDLVLALHPGMGPGGVLWRSVDEMIWSTLDGASPWGPERLPEMSLRAVGHGRDGADDRPFRGGGLEVLSS